MSKALISLLLAVALSGCSAQQGYQAIQQNCINDCETKPPIERETCLAQYQQSYEEYEAERKRLKGERRNQND